MHERCQLVETLDRWDERTSPIPYEELVDGLSLLELGPDDLAGCSGFDDRCYYRVSIRLEGTSPTHRLRYQSGRGR